MAFLLTKNAGKMTIQPKLTRFDLTMIIISLVIGIGIFRTPSIVAQNAQSPIIFFLAWIVGGIVSLCGALTFAEIGSRHPAAGGFYKIFSYCYHPAYAFMLNWVLVITVSASNTGVALIGAEYIAPVILPEHLQGDIAIKVISIVILTILFLLNFMGIKMGARAQNVLSSLKVFLMFILIATLFFVTGAVEPAEVTYGTGKINYFYAFGVSIISVFFTYGGYQHTMNLGADIKEPQKNIPMASFIAIGIILFLYITINYAYYHALGFQGIMNSKLVAAELAGKFLGSFGSKAASIIIFISVLGFLNTSLLTYPRIYYAMAEDKILPPIFKRINEKTQVGEFSLTVYFLLMVINVFFLGTFEKIVNYVMFIDSLALATAAATIFILRREQKGMEYTGYKIKLFPLVPVVFMILISAVTINVLLSDLSSALIGLAFFILGYPIFKLMRKMDFK